LDESKSNKQFTLALQYPLCSRQTEIMMITIDLDSPEPLFNQLIEQIKQAISQQSLKPGDALPSIRQLASELDINAKTVAKAYKLHERDQVIESKGYRGSFVHQDAQANAQQDIKVWLQAQIEAHVSQYRQKGATDSEIRILFNQAMNRSHI
jgi:GntR family transcriptional regulator